MRCTRPLRCSSCEGFQGRSTLGLPHSLWVDLNLWGADLSDALHPPLTLFEFAKGSRVDRHWVFLILCGSTSISGGTCVDVCPPERNIF